MPILFQNFRHVWCMAINSARRMFCIHGNFFAIPRFLERVVNTMSNIFTFPLSNVCLFGWFEWHVRVVEKLGWVFKRHALLWVDTPWGGWGLDGRMGWGVGGVGMWVCSNLYCGSLKCLVTLVVQFGKNFRGFVVCWQYLLFVGYRSMFLWVYSYGVCIIFVYCEFMF